MEYTAQNSSDKIIKVYDENGRQIENVYSYDDKTKKVCLFIRCKDSNHLVLVEGKPHLVCTKIPNSYCKIKKRSD